MSGTPKTPVPPATALQDRLAACAAEGPDAIDARLEQLEGEWTAGRMVKATLGVAILAGFALATLHDPYWLILPAIAGGFLLQYVFFRGGVLAKAFCGLGFRGGKEIDDERFALRTLRGDFRNLPTVHEVEDKDSVCRFEDEGGLFRRQVDRLGDQQPLDFEFAVPDAAAELLEQDALVQRVLVDDEHPVGGFEHEVRVVKLERGGRRT